MGDQSSALQLAPTGGAIQTFAFAPPMDQAYWAHKERQERTRRRQIVLISLRTKAEPPLNEQCAMVVHGFNYLLQYIETLSNEEFMLRLRHVVHSNLQSLRPVKNVYVDDFLDEVGVYDYAHRRVAAGLLLKRIPLARSDPRGTLKRIYAIVGQDRMAAWKEKLVAENEPNIKVRWNDYRNPYKPGNMHCTLNL